MLDTSDIISTKCANFRIIEEGVIEIILLENAEIDLEESKLMQRTSLSVMQEKRFVALIDARATVVVSKESREWGSSAEAQKNMLAQAIIVNSMASRIIGNFIIKFHKPIAKTALFSDEKHALQWLYEQKKFFNI